MKLLIDRMLSRRLEQFLETHYPGTEHADRTQKEDAEDAEIWEYARNNGFTILTKDADFLELAERQGWPPKLIKLNLGNCSNEEVTELLITRKQEIREFHANEERGLLLLK